MIARSLPFLIHDLVLKKHEGNELKMSMVSGIPQATIWRWRRGVAGGYRVDLLRRLAECYRIPIRELGRVVNRDFQRLLEGRPIPLPTVKVSRGPKVRRV